MDEGESSGLLALRLALLALLKLSYQAVFDVILVLGITLACHLRSLHKRFRQLSFVHQARTLELVAR
jgi:preprotein translocase subunit Sec63